MGYELHITRIEHWADPEAPIITLEEWLEYVKDDTELLLTNGYSSGFSHTQTFQESPGFCEWLAHPVSQETNSRPWFSYSRGTIDTKNLDSHTIRKMVQIALELNANVQGDDGELYDEDSIKEMENFEKSGLVAEVVKKPWWKFW